MSADIYVTLPTCAACGREYESIDFNLTYNLSPMLWGAGMPDWATFKGMRACDAGLIWEAVADELKRDPDLYRSANPPNGWGTYDQAVEVLAGLADTCSRHPDGWIELCL